MAQRRVNVRFVGIALVVVVGVLGSLLLARAFLFKKDPHKYVQLAEDFRKNNDLVNAAINYKAAVDLNPKDLHVRVLYGDVLHDLARADQGYMGQDRQAWDGVLTA